MITVLYTAQVYIRLSKKIRDCQAFRNLSTTKVHMALPYINPASNSLALDRNTGINLYTCFIFNNII